MFMQNPGHGALPNGFSNVAKGVDSSPANGLLVCFEEVQQLKADPHPLSRGDKLCPPVCNAAYEVNAVLLHLLMPEACQEGREGRGEREGGRGQRRERGGEREGRRQRGQENSEHKSECSKALLCFTDRRPVLGLI